MIFFSFCWEDMNKSSNFRNVAKRKPLLQTKAEKQLVKSEKSVMENEYFKIPLELQGTDHD